MRKLVVTEFVSIDGVMDSPEGEPGYKRSGWTFATRTARTTSSTSSTR